MGHHYVPQKYLRGFAETGNPGAIWMYDKKLHQFTNPGIKIVAQEAGFYTNDEEQQLNELVEKPANKVLDKLKNQERITDIDRFHLSIYIATMMKRVPKHRTEAYAMIPSVFEKTIAKVRTQIQEWGQTIQNEELLQRKLIELEAAEEPLRNEVPEFLREQIREPWANEEWISAIYTMTWRVVRSPASDFYITSDNPAYFFKDNGIATPKSELTFPISTDLALFASWQGEQNTTIYAQARPALVREANKRLMSGAERFVFSHRKVDWIAKISDKPNPYLPRIRW